MPTISRTSEFAKWLDDLKDRNGCARIIVRIQRLEQGNAGQVNHVGEGVSELKIDVGPGYRVYFKQTGADAVMLLCGGDKDSQQKDIARAKELARQLKE
jgi:putative addiction module killer protein